MMGKYIRVNGTLYRALDVADPKMLKILKDKVSSILKPMETGGFTFIEKARADGIDIYAKSKTASRDDFEEHIRGLQRSFGSLKSKIAAIQDLPFFYSRWKIGVEFTSEASKIRSPWLVAKIRAKELQSGKSLTHGEYTSERNKDDSNSIRALGILKKDLSREAINFSDVLMLAGRIGKLDPKIAGEMSIWAKRVSSERDKFLSRLSDIK